MHSDLFDEVFHYRNISSQRHRDVWLALCLAVNFTIMNSNSVSPYSGSEDLFLHFKTPMGSYVLRLQKIFLKSFSLLHNSGERIN